MTDLKLAEGEHLFTSESVTEGHPDKIADQISDTILDACLSQDPHSRVACETLVNTGMAVISGELTTSAQIDITDLVRKTVCEIGYDKGEYGYDGNNISVLVSMDKQSPDIAQGVDTGIETRTGGSSDQFDLDGAGDQGMMFGYATNETEALMPMPIQIAHRLSERLSLVRKDGTLPYLRPDGKTQVTVRYADGKPIAVERVLISTQHAPDVENENTIRPDLWENVILPVLAEEYGDLLDEDLYNHAGVWQTWPGYSEQERIAAEFAYRFATDHTGLRDDEDFWARAAEHFSDELLTDLALSCAMWLGMGRMLRTLDIGQACKITL